MNFKNFKLGIKLAIGFGALIVISLILGVMSMINMDRIAKESKALAHEYVPEVKIATDLRGAANRVMYEMRGYGFTEEEKFYQQALNEIEAIKSSITEGEKLNREAKRLVKLAEQLKVAEDATTRYVELVTQTHEVNAKMKGSRVIMDESAQLFFTNCKNYQTRQYNVMTREIQTGGTTASRLQKVTLINEILEGVNIIRINNFKSQAKRDPAILQDALIEFSSVHQLISEIRNITRVQSDLQALDIIEQEVQDYQDAMNTFIDDWIKRETLGGKRDETGKELIAACIATANAGLTGTQQIADNAITSLTRSNGILFWGLILAVVIGIVFAFFITKIITEPVKIGVAFTQQMADGDLTATINVDQKDEIGQLTAALSNMGQRLHGIVEEILTGANNIAAASQQMAGTSQQLSQGANEQASSVEEVTSSMEEMSANIQQNTESASTTEKIALGASKEIRIGSEATNTAAESMKNIAEKIQIINDIAFQTNILALNAAVEAARAGEHGKGFAVVASEVRKLAEHSKVAAGEIDELSKSGVEISEKAGTKLSEIVPEIERTAQLVQEIAAASQEQNSGADQVNSAMQQLNNVTQQNASASEELASGAEELASQAEKLKDTINFFKIGNHSNTSNIKLRVHEQIDNNPDTANNIELATTNAELNSEFENF